MAGLVKYRIVAAALLLAAVVLLRLVSGGTLASDHSLVQIVLFPFVVFLIYPLIRVGGRRLPALLRFSALVMGLLACAAFYMFAGTGKGFLVVSDLDQDPLGSRSRALAELLRDYSGNDQPVIRSMGSVSTFSDAESLGEAYQADWVVYGDTSRLYLMFRRASSSTLGELNLVPEWSGLSDLTLIESLPVIGVPLQPASETTAFVAAVAQAAQPEYFGREHDLRATGLLVGAWPTRSHRAYPWFLLANQHFLRAFSGDYQQGEMACALEAYFNASDFLLGTLDPELAHAINNNMALLYLLRGFYEGRPAWQRAAVNRFQRLTVSGPSESFPLAPIQPLGVGLDNLAALETIRNLRPVKQ